MSYIYSDTSRESDAYALPNVDTMTTQTTITDPQIRQLRREAAQHGDERMIEICDTAIGARRADAWWRWHDADYSRAYTDMDEADAACAAWVDGDSDHGPDRDEARAECARVIADAEAQ